MGAAAFGCMPKGDASKVEHKLDNKDAEGRKISLVIYLNGIFAIEWTEQSKNVKVFYCHWSVVEQLYSPYSPLPS